MLLLPKVLGLTLAMLRPLPGKPVFGRLRLLAGGFVEIALSVLMAPVFMLTQTTAVVQILAGRDSGWAAQRRDGKADELRQVLRFHAWHVVVGTALAIACATTSVYVLAWMSPIIVGLVLSAPISWLTSQAGGALASTLLATPEEMEPPPIVTAVLRGQRAWSEVLEKRAEPSLQGCVGPIVARGRRVGSPVIAAE